MRMLNICEHMYFAHAVFGFSFFDKAGLTKIRRLHLCEHTYLAHAVVGFYCLIKRSHSNSSVNTCTVLTQFLFSYLLLTRSH